MEQHSKKGTIQEFLRYVRFNLKTDSENHYRESLLLFLPWRNEDTDLIKNYNTYEEHFNAVKCIV